MAAYTVYWSADRVAAWRKAPQPVKALFGGPHTGQPSFIRAGVAPGDTLFIISISKGRLMVFASCEAGEVEELSPGQSPSPWGDHSNPKWLARANVDAALLYSSLCVTCTDHVLTVHNMTVPQFDRALDQEALRAFQFLNKRGTRCPKGVETGQVTSPLAFQGIYRVHEDSALAMTECLEGQPTTRTPPSPADERLLL